MNQEDEVITGQLNAIVRATQTRTRLHLLQYFMELIDKREFTLNLIEDILLIELRDAVSQMAITGRVKVGHPLEGNTFKLIAVHGDVLSINIDGEDHTINYKLCELEFSFDKPS